MDNLNKFTTIISFLLLPTLALGNAGSPMMWFGIVHLFLINAYIGWVESFILENYKIPNKTRLIIIGNYVSMFVGLFLIAPYFSKYTGNNDFWGGQTNFGDYNLHGFVFGMMASFFATLLIEFTFFYLAVIDKMHRKLIYIPFIVANVFTNIIMTSIYFWINSRGSHW